MSAKQPGVEGGIPYLGKGWILKEKGPQDHTPQDGTVIDRYFSRIPPTSMSHGVCTQIQQLPSGH